MSFAPLPSREGFQPLLVVSGDRFPERSFLALQQVYPVLDDSGLFSNLPLFAAVVLTLLLQMAAICTPFLNRALKTTPLTVPELGLVVAASSLVFFAVEAEKSIRRIRAALGIRRQRTD